jgi:hypothetical protein
VQLPTGMGGDRHCSNVLLDRRARTRTTSTDWINVDDIISDDDDDDDEEDDDSNDDDDTDDDDDDANGPVKTQTISGEFKNPLPCN